uniref:Uncharacterized protein n=1 Tax=Pelagomonas calceolata TaxID=35677 RepID=A0A6S8SCW4_9STRA|mmetsp:Transcript_15234/g.47900  ORF Transcript_15234/g.47900 Transcript_15234/m.47900 type:complete len:115 (+) Transcript_15234:140-484(+)
MWRRVGRIVYARCLRGPRLQHLQRRPLPPPPQPRIHCKKLPRPKDAALPRADEMDNDGECEQVAHSWLREVRGHLQLQDAPLLGRKYHMQPYHHQLPQLMHLAQPARAQRRNYL